jgi:hypothetical protein
MNDAGWVRLYELDLFLNLKPAEKKSGAIDKVQINPIGFAISIMNIALFGLFLCLNFRNFSPAFFGVWLELLFAGIYSIVLGELISNIAVKKLVVIIGYSLLCVMWLSIVIGVFV